MRRQSRDASRKGFARAATQWALDELRTAGDRVQNRRNWKRQGPLDTGNRSQSAFVMVRLQQVSQSSKAGNK